MKRWEQRPPEIANLLNPAFCAVIVQHAVAAHQKESGKPLDLPLVFLIAPIVLHSDTRRTLPNKINTRLHPWLEQHEHIKLGFDQRARGLVPLVKEALSVGHSGGLLHLDSGWGIVSMRKTTRKGMNGGDLGECLDAAAFVGRWLPRGGTTATIFSLFGVAP
jgi:hypothetical protein